MILKSNNNNNNNKHKTGRWFYKKKNSLVMDSYEQERTEVGKSKEEEIAPYQYEPPTARQHTILPTLISVLHC